MNIVNAVGGGSLHRDVHLDKLARSISCPVARYDPEHHPSLYIKLEEDGAVILLFRTGKYNIAGASSVEDLISTNEEFLAVMTDLGIEQPEFEDSFEVRNLVYEHDFRTEFDLSTLAIGLGMEHSEYEPEQFPGLQYSPPEIDGLFLIFRTGKVILTGTKTEEEADDAFSVLNSKFEDLGIN